ncbi:MAG: ABC transporter ATP-binding protein/permease [Pirellulales bacterium]|nr:ABC transporter ATP-binding protein/permease [Pirellulales bacterium]
MNNFARALRHALRRRWLVAATLVCSLAVALFWAGNIAAVLPIVDGVMHGKSIPDMLEEKIADTKGKLSEIDQELTGLEAEGGNQAEIARLKTDRVAESAWLTSYEMFLERGQQWLPTTAFGTLTLICLALFAGTLLKSVFRVAGAFLMARLGHLVNFELRKQFYRRTIRLDLGTFRGTTPGDLMNRFTTEVGSIAAGTQTLFGMAVREPLKMIACLCVAAYVSWQLLLLTLISAPLAIYAIHWLAKALKRANRRASEEFSVVFDHLEETFGGMKVIKAFTMESRERSRFHRASKQYYRRSMRIAFYNSLASPVIETMGVGMILAAMIAGGYLVLNEQTHLFGIRISEKPLTHGWITLFYASLAGASDPVRRFSSVFNNLQRAAAACDRVFELFDRTTQIKDPTAPVELPTRLGRVRFQDVSFAYQPDEPVLDRVNLEVASGETVAIVGPNGCGKSTLMNLLPRFYDPCRGAVTIDGHDLREFRIRDLRCRLGVVTQETLLFDDTVANNIRYGSPGTSEQQLVQAAQQAHAHRFITEKLADGYDTMCGPSGDRLSGGQRQRIALARAILRDPDILILDEATSQIDVESERLIHEVLEKFIVGRTVFMITHRPSTLALADRIVVMDHGRIVDVGSFDELSARCELFRRLAHLEYRESA